MSSNELASKQEERERLFSDSRVLKALLTLAMGGFAVGTGEFVIMGLLPDVAQGLNISITDAGHLISIYALGVVIGAPLLAIIGAHLPRKTFLLILIAMFAFGNVFSTLGADYHMMLLARFVAGIPHGTLFGVSALVAAGLVSKENRAKAVSMVLLGLTVANLAGVPVVAFIGEYFGWRSAFAIVAGLAIVTFIMIAFWIPQLPGDKNANPLRELKALGNKQVIFTLGIGAIGSGGLFAIYSYVKPTMFEVAHLPTALLPFVLALFGLGMILGNLAGGRLADQGVERAIRIILIGAAIIMFAFVFLSQYTYLAVINLMFVGTIVALATVLQIRLMDVAGDAQTMAAAMNHSAFNMANALGPWLGGLTISAGFGWQSTGWVGGALALAGLLIHYFAVRDAKHK